MTKYAIEKNIGRPLKYSYEDYPFAEMAVGDSFFVPDPMVDRKMSLCLCRIANYWTRKHRNGWKFSVKSYPDGVRVWRVQ
jgi:hypothetical protein